MQLIAIPVVLAADPDCNYQNRLCTPSLSTPAGALCKTSGHSHKGDSIFLPLLSLMSPDALIGWREARFLSLLL